MPNVQLWHFSKDKNGLSQYSYLPRKINIYTKKILPNCDFVILLEAVTTNHENKQITLQNKNE